MAKTKTKTKVGIECGDGWISRDKICRGGKSDEVAQQLDDFTALAPKKSLKQLADTAAVKISAETKKTARAKISTKEEKKKLLQEEKEAWVFLRTYRKKEALLKKKGSDSSEEIDRLTSLLQKISDGDSEALEKAYADLLLNIEEAKKVKVSKASEKKIEKVVSLVAAAIETSTKDEKNLSAVAVAVAQASTEGLKYSKYIPTKLAEPTADKIKLEKEISGLVRVPTSPNKQLIAEGLDATILVEKLMPNYAFTPILETPDSYREELKVWEDNKDLILKNLSRNQYDAKLKILQSVPNMSDFNNRKEFIDSAELATKTRILVNAALSTRDWDFIGFASKFSEDFSAKNNHIAIYYGEPASVGMPVGDEKIRGQTSIPPLPSAMNKGDGVNDNSNKDIRNFLEEADVYMQVSTEALESIVKDDKFKNMFNRGAVNSIGGGDSDYRETRKLCDTKVFGLNPKAKPDERPIFGYIQNKNRALSEGFEKVKDYGQIQIKFKPSIKKRTSFTIGDSLGHPLSSGELASPVLNPKIISSSGTAPKLEGNSANEIRMTYPPASYKLPDYVEAQIFGNTKLEDIEMVRIPADLAKNNPQLIAKLQSLGIYVAVFVPY